MEWEDVNGANRSCSSILMLVWWLVKSWKVEKLSKCYVYRYMIGDQWIYVGKANNSLHERIRAHAKEERFQPYLGSCKISYFEFEHASDMTHAEAALIKIQKPVLNVSGKNDSHFPFSVDTNAMQWIEYRSPQEIREEKKRKGNKESWIKNGEC